LQLAVGVVVVLIGGCASAGLRRGVPFDLGRGYPLADVTMCVTRVKHAGGVEHSVERLMLQKRLDLPCGPMEIDVRLCDREAFGHTFTVAFEAQCGGEYEVAATCAISSMAEPSGGGDHLCAVIVREAATSKILGEALNVDAEE
jgi:hypothetical protein